MTISKWTATTKYTAYLECIVTCTTLSGRKGVSALPVIEVEAAITAEGAYREAAPVKASRLLTTAVVIRVARALEARSIKPSLMVKCEPCIQCYLLEIDEDIWETYVGSSQLDARGKSNKRRKR